jgi:hypothetical protein
MKYFESADSDNDVLYVSTVKSDHIKVPCDDDKENMNEIKAQLHSMLIMQIIS